MYKYDDEVLGLNSSRRKFSTEPEYQEHVVAKGDTLYNISKRYNTSVEAIKNANNITGTNIAIGQVLKIK